MNSTETFIIFTLIATVIIFVIAVSTQSVKNAKKIACGFYVFCIFSSLLFLILNTSFAFKLIAINDTYSAVLRLLIYRGWIVIGTGISAALLVLLNVFGAFRSTISSKAIRSLITSQYILKGLYISVASTYLAFEIGKLMHDEEIRQFFLDSGYAVWFMYFVIAAEILGSIALFISKTTIPAALGLMILMLGAIYTHYHDKDPFNASLDALHLLIILICIIIIKIFRARILSDENGEEVSNQ